MNHIRKLLHLYQMIR